ncbi:hypothetical protein SO694_0000539 [Aureococcus anophagefferens]|uniref:Ankyrin repeat protein n=1 Tax=Aureococcus anophagefferens TaxID=44056 RepID=A0ABR1G9G5_AURAN
MPPKQYAPTPLDEELCRACSDGDAAAVKKLLERGASPTCGTRVNGWSPLHYAATCADEAAAVAVIHVLERAGADVDGRSMNEATPSTRAAFKGHAKSLAALLELGADANLHNDEGSTPLHAACAKGHAACAALLLENGADATRLNSDGETPLDRARATRRGDFEGTVAVLLRARGAAAADDELVARDRLLFANPGKT